MDKVQWLSGSENKTIRMSRQPVPKPVLESAAFRVWSRVTEHCTVTFGKTDPIYPTDVSEFHRTTRKYIPEDMVLPN
jgi:hypothetical protein